MTETVVAIRHAEEAGAGAGGGVGAAGQCGRRAARARVSAPGGHAPTGPAIRSLGAAGAALCRAGTQWRDGRSARRQDRVYGEARRAAGPGTPAASPAPE